MATIKGSRNGLRGTKAHILALFQEHPEKVYSFDEVCRRFPSLNRSGISQHLRRLREDRIHLWLLQPKMGEWQLNPKHRSIDEVRSLVQVVGAQRVQPSAAPFSGKTAPLVASVSDDYFREHMLDLVERLRSAVGFTAFDVRGLQRLIGERWGPLEDA
jgi:hypothetical protein